MIYLILLFQILHSVALIKIYQLIQDKDFESRWYQSEKDS